MFDTTFNVNARAPLLLIKYFVDAVRKQNSMDKTPKGGTIVNIGSVNAHCGQNDLLVYSMSKGALQTMTRNLADDLSKDLIRINQLNVGWCHSEKENQTQLNEGRPADWYNHIPRTAAPFGRILSPQDIAPHCRFWLSEQSFPVTGQCYECEQYPLIGRNKLNEL